MRGMAGLCRHLMFFTWLSLGAPSPCPAAESAVAHPFACTDYSEGKVFIVSRSGQVEWEYPAASCNDLWVLPNGNLLFNTGHGVREVTRDKQVVFDYQSKSEIYACQRLTNGNTFIGECNAGRLLEVEPSGQHRERNPPVGRRQGRRARLHAQRPAAGQWQLPGRPLWRPGGARVRSGRQGRAQHPGRRRAA